MHKKLSKNGSNVILSCTRAKQTWNKFSYLNTIHKNTVAISPQSRSRNAKYCTTKLYFQFTTVSLIAIHMVKLGVPYCRPNKFPTSLNYLVIFKTVIAEYSRFTSSDQNFKILIVMVTAITAPLNYIHLDSAFTITVLN